MLHNQNCQQALNSDLSASFMRNNFVKYAHVCVTDFWRNRVSPLQRTGKDYGLAKITTSLPKFHKGAVWPKR